MGIKIWDIKKIDNCLVEEIIKETNLPPLVCYILFARGFDNKEKIKALFLDDKISDPYELKDMDKAVARLVIALDSNEKIAVYGDYDCDGITATALLYSYLESVGADVVYYIPDRDSEGYGLNKIAIQKLKDDYVDLIITVDNGISAVDEIAFANSLSIDVIVTDHHKPREILPNAVAVVDPHRNDCKSGLTDFSGVGIAFKLVCAMENDETGEMLDYYSDLVSIGTIADVVRLTGESRTIVKHGLEKLNDRIGVSALIEICGLAEKELSAQDVSFGIVPRLNAAGRLGNAETSLRLLLTDDYEYAKELANEINEYNVARKETETIIINDIAKQIESNHDIINQRVIIVFGENWHHGVIGIVCSKIVEKYGKPCILISIEGETARASGRSIEGFSLVDAIEYCSDLLIRFGGHNLAAGLSIETKNIEQFIEKILSYAKEKFNEMPDNLLKIDKVLDDAELSVANIKSLSSLEPFGAGNEYPLFAIKNLTIAEIIPIGQGKHLKLKLINGKNTIYAVYFGMTATKFSYVCADIVDIAATVDINNYNDEERLSIKIKDIRLSSLNQNKLSGGKKAYESYSRGERLSFDKSLIIPTREDITGVYKYLKKVGEVSCEYDVLYSRVATKELNYCKMHIIVDILAELGLISIINTANGKTVRINNTSEKVDINTSKILIDLHK